jgi:hypothetical protein
MYVIFTRRWRPPLAPEPQGTSPVGSPRREADGTPLRYGGFRAASSAEWNHTNGNA